eukprot:71475-Chlamydomonas_euryale.AAC.2
MRGRGRCRCARRAFVHPQDDTGGGGAARVAAVTIDTKQSCWPWQVAVFNLSAPPGLPSSLLTAKRDQLFQLTVKRDRTFQLPAKRDQMFSCRSNAINLMIKRQSPVACRTTLPPART